MKQLKANNCVNSSNKRRGQAVVLRRSSKVASLSLEVPCSSSNSRTSSKRGATKVCRLSKRIARNTQELKMKAWQVSKGEYPAQLLIRIAHLRIIMTETEPSVRMSLLPLTSSLTT